MKNRAVNGGVSTTSHSVHIFGLKRRDVRIESLAENLKKSYTPNQHTEEEIKIIRNYCYHNINFALVEHWHRLRKKDTLADLKVFTK